VWPAKPKPDPELLALFEESARNVQRVARLLRDLLTDYPEELRGLRTGAALASHLVEIHRLENEADRLQRAAIAGLFANGIDPMVLIRWKDIFDTLEAAVDACESVANVLEGIAIKRRAGIGEAQPSARTAKTARARTASWPSLRSEQSAKASRPPTRSTCVCASSQAPGGTGRM
jgi:hypothetical protein